MITLQAHPLLQARLGLLAVLVHDLLISLLLLQAGLGIPLLHGLVVLIRGVAVLRLLLVWPV